MYRKSLKLLNKLKFSFFVGSSAFALNGNSLSLKDDEDFVHLILTFSWFQNGQTSYEEFEVIMKAGTDWGSIFNIDSLLSTDEYLSLSSSSKGAKNGTRGRLLTSVCCHGGIAEQVNAPPSPQLNKKCYFQSHSYMSYGFLGMHVLGFNAHAFTHFIDERKRRRSQVTEHAMDEKLRRTVINVVLPRFVDTRSAILKMMLDLLKDGRWYQGNYNMADHLDSERNHGTDKSKSNTKPFAQQNRHTMALKHLHPTPSSNQQPNISRRTLDNIEKGIIELALILGPEKLDKIDNDAILMDAEWKLAELSNESIQLLDIFKECIFHNSFDTF
uniref:Uncharacterized protein n=1 Tax=Tanacetum cinerariifolium TaxID=118510 RepID=A0A6L2M607_TANCI|nr:hypothetical protein [Tanacetum cinerariifolium]